MKKRQMVNGIVLLMSISLILIIIMQTIHLRNSYKSSKEIVERGIAEAVSRSIVVLQKHDAVFFVYDKLNPKNKNIDSLVPVDPYWSQLGLSPIFNQYSNIHFQSFPGSDLSSLSFYSGFSDFSDIEAYMFQQFAQKTMEFEQIITQLETEFLQRQIPIENRFDTETVNSILKKSLASVGLDIDFEFAISDNKQRIKLKSSNFDVKKTKDCYQFNLTPASFFTNPDVLLVNFPNKEKYVLETIYAQLGTSIILILIFIITFGFALYALIKQKKNAEIKNDFINNMTHEFKTPIATIKLAAASMQNNKAKENPELVNNMLNIISQETNRMNSHVEQVLQMAVLDKKNVELKTSIEDINNLIIEIVKNIELAVLERGGEIKLDLCENNPNLRIDRDLMANVLNNLLDNAMKYSKDFPEITLSTYIRNNIFNISIEDKGIGMSKDVLNKIFDRFYRVHTGNVHDIKGFGLGLNYANEIVNAHNGHINVKSTLGKGSVFIVSLPIIN
ncbi:MAG: HAMP domain-containing histidine kinase [Bacteroidales bacterium]|nr:HAMP domain-containing histidine kinase [Bacteroidales bacterium]MCK9499720.1 HAMP domain-containing histidine kinase [Bacteroidales bacterium]MDY0314421.1 HAMP domain-containing sensor histidine kinase [Bacteroidales bacterium]NLB86733.1 HAMP domain-containing histidine kinase [Bacteroidales bacterium]